MPRYEYKCLTCGKELEIEHSIKEDARKQHLHGENCDGPLKRLIAGNVSFVWKNGAPTSKTYV